MFMWYFIQLSSEINLLHRRARPRENWEIEESPLVRESRGESRGIVQVRGAIHHPAEDGWETTHVCQTHWSTGDDWDSGIAELMEDKGRGECEEEGWVGK